MLWSICRRTTPARHHPTRLSLVCWLGRDARKSEEPGYFQRYTHLYQLGTVAVTRSELYPSVFYYQCTTGSPHRPHTVHGTVIVIALHPGNRHHHLPILRERNVLTPIAIVSAFFYLATTWFGLGLPWFASTVWLYFVMCLRCGVANNTGYKRKTFDGSMLCYCLYPPHLLVKPWLQRRSLFLCLGTRTSR